MFNPVIVELHNQKVNREIQFHYHYGDEVKLITSITSPCGCTRVTNDSEFRNIVVNYTPQDIPIHIIKQGRNFYDTVKIITITYLNTSDAELVQKLVFTAKITKR